jgi:hypothetical protein
MFDKLDFLLMNIFFYPLILLTFHILEMFKFGNYLIDLRCSLSDSYSGV